MQIPARMLALAAAVTLLSAACGSDKGESAGGAPAGQAATGNPGVLTQVQTTEGDFHITLRQNTAPAGRVQFNVQNLGPSTHELVLFRTDLGAANLPVRGVAVDEEGSGITHIDEEEAVHVGSSTSLAVDLTPGTYVLLCNLPLHYLLGMHTTFTVK